MPAPSKKPSPLSSPMLLPSKRAQPHVNTGPSPALGKFGPGRPPEFQGTPVIAIKDGGLRSTITSKK